MLTGWRRGSEGWGSLLNILSLVCHWYSGFVLNLLWAPPKIFAPSRNWLSTSNFYYLSYNNRRSRSGTYSSRSRSRSRSHSESPRRHHNHGSPHLKAKHTRDDLKSSNRHGHKRKKSRSRSQSKSRDHSDAVKKHRHERGHHRDRRERSRSFERSHKGKHHGGSRSGHGRHRRWLSSFEPASTPDFAHLQCDVWTRNQNIKSKLIRIWFLKPSRSLETLRTFSFEKNYVFWVFFFLHIKCPSSI